MKTPSVELRAREDLDPHIEFTEQHGIVEVRDRRLFRRGHEAFCRRLVESAARRTDIRSATVALGSVTCRLQFAGGWRSAEWMARQFVEILQEAIPELAPREGPVEGDFDWATVSAFPAGETVSCWQAVLESSSRLRLHNEILRLDSGIARRVARALREVPGIVACRVVSFRRDLTVAYDPSQRASLAVIDAAETCLRRVRHPSISHDNTNNSQNPLTQITGRSE